MGSLRTLHKSRGQPPPPLNKAAGLVRARVSDHDHGRERRTKPAPTVTRLHAGKRRLTSRGAVVSRNGLSNRISEGDAAVVTNTFQTFYGHGLPIKPVTNCRRDASIVLSSLCYIVFDPNIFQFSMQRTAKGTYWNVELSIIRVR